MKNLVLVSGVHDVPERVRQFLYVVSVNSWEEAVLYLSGRTKDVAMFWGEGVPVERLLKAVEDFSGNLLVYSEQEVGPVMRSRFTRVLRGRQVVEWKVFDQPSQMLVLLNHVKRSMVGVT